MGGYPKNAEWHEGSDKDAIFQHSSVFRGRNFSYKLETNENISGIRINDYEIRNIQHGDDLTITVQDENSLSQALNTVHEFCKHAGSKVNINKTECISLGPLKDAYDEILGNKLINKAVKCLGIYIGHNKEECYDKNWMKTSHDVEKLFESWKKEN